MLQKYNWTIRFLILTPILLLLSIFLMGGGHGFFEPTFVLFPWATMLFFWYDTMNFAFLSMALIQYPVYGLILDKYKSQYIGLFITLLHIVLAILSYISRPQAFL